MNRESASAIPFSSMLISGDSVPTATEEMKVRSLV